MCNAWIFCWLYLIDCFEDICWVWMYTTEPSIIIHWPVQQLQFSILTLRSIFGIAFLVWYVYSICVSCHLLLDGNPQTTVLTYTHSMSLFILCLMLISHKGTSRKSLSLFFQSVNLTCQDPITVVSCARDTTIHDCMYYELLVEWEDECVICILFLQSTDTMTWSTTA